jgi:DNA helicase-2/ATP-dependent DNA helicase PcrA
VDLNPEQQSAVDHFYGPCLVTAVPGSGKTATLTSRVIELVKNKNINPGHLLCLTFTNKAANEMKSRVADTVGRLSEKIWISTFHSLCLAVLRKYADRVNLTPSFSVYSENDQIELMTKVARMHEYTCQPYQIKQLAKISNDFREDIEDFDKYVEPLSIIEKGILKEYLHLLDEFNAVDFSGILYKTWTLLSKNLDVVERLHSKFQFIMIDEMQDTNTIQYEIVKIIADPKSEGAGNIFCVGDFCQAIFSWRGAKPENINLFKKDFKNVLEIILPRNYRSTKRILRAAQSLIRNNPGAESVELISDKDEGHKVNINSHTFPEDEIKYVIQNIKMLREQYKFNWSDFAILYRVNSFSKTPEMFLRSAGIPYKIVGGFSFFDRKEIKTAMSYLSYLSNPHDTVAFARAISSPRRGIGDVAIGKLERICHKDKVDMIESCNRASEIKLGASALKNLNDFNHFVKYYRDKMPDMGMSEITTGFLSDTGYYGDIQKASLNDALESKRIENLDEFLKGVCEFEKQKPNAKLGDYLQSIQILNDFGSESDEDAVTMLTMHSAKGLEFPVVFIIGAESGIIPHKMALQERGPDEERRLLYVGMTRARRILSINYCTCRSVFNKNAQKNSMMRCRPSEFLSEIDVD